VGDDVYFTGYADFVKVIHADNLANMDFYQTMLKVCRYLQYVFIPLLVICLIGLIPKTRKMAAKLLRKMWLHRMAYIMLAPTFTLIILFNYRGIVLALIRAFTDWSRTNNTVAKMSFIGLDNFRTMLTEGYFLTGMKNLLLLMATGILKTLTVPLVLAWLVYNIRGAKRKYLHRFLFVLPIVVPGVIGALIWQRIYDPTIGLLTNILAKLHLDSLQRVWLGDAKTAIWAVIFMGFPFVGAMAFLVYYGGFINIDQEIIESARIDGGSRWNIFWRVQLPMIRPQINILITLQIIGSMQDFNGIYILTGGGPGTATYVPALELYFNAAQFGRYGYASALGVVLLIFTLTVTIIGNHLTKEKE
jgi:ABC-type sugar transport system permease subunit